MMDLMFKSLRMSSIEECMADEGQRSREGSPSWRREIAGAGGAEAKRNTYRSKASRGGRRIPQPVKHEEESEKHE